MPDVIWQGPEHGDGETLRGAFRRITGQDFDPQRCLFEEWCGDRTAYHWRDGWADRHGMSELIDAAGLRREGGGGC